MDVYIYSGDIYGAVAGEEIIAQLTEEGKAPADPANESSYDSNDFPKGPYPNGGGEADTPQHCARYGTFLENPLTEDGLTYVRDRLAANAQGESGVMAEWREFYADELDDATDDEDDGLPA